MEYNQSLGDGVNSTYTTDACKMEQDTQFIIGTFISSLGVVCNVAFMFVVSRVRSMRTVTNAYLVTLAVADLLHSVVHNVIWSCFYFGGHSCVLYDAGFYCGVMFPSRVTQYVSMFTITILSFERYMALCKPMMYRKGVIHSKRFVVLVIITTWVVSSLISLEGLVDCLFSKTRSVEGRLLYLISVLILLLITTVLYALIIHRVRKSKKAVKKREKQIIRICFSTALVYFLCTMPTVLHAIVMCLYHFDLIAIYWDLVICLMNTSTFLLEINSSVNPILYNALSSIYRKAFKEAFTGPLTEHCSAAYNKLQKRPSHSTELSELNQQKTSERSKPSAE